MDQQDLRAALVAHFPGCTIETDPVLDLALSHHGARWGFALCEDREGGVAYLGAFETAMQRLVDARKAQSDGLHLGLAIAFASTAAGQHPSYRRALKKYSNSVVFEDLGLSLYLIRGEADLVVLSPQEINPFLRELDDWISRQRIK